MKTSFIRDAILGLVVGDALGVPVEFKSRSYLKKNPVVSMIGQGTYNQPPGTWSDDSSLTLCLAEELSKGYYVAAIGESFVQWLYQNHWTARGQVFDVGRTTHEALQRIKNGTESALAGCSSEDSNGNGSLMRILPLVLEFKSLPERQKRFSLVKEVSSITHAHIRSCLACYYYLEFAACILESGEPSFLKAYSTANEALELLAKEQGIAVGEISPFMRLLSGGIMHLKEDEIQSTGYVVSTLEASIWCLLSTTNYREAVLKAVNLGDDSDTTGAVTGGLAGIYYGASSIPAEWLREIARLKDIEKLIVKLRNRYANEASFGV